MPRKDLMLFGNHKANFEDEKITNRVRALILKAVSSNDSRLWSALYASGLIQTCDQSIVDEHGVPILWLAIEHGNALMVKNMLQRPLSFDVNAYAAPLGRETLDVAIDANPINTVIIERLLAHQVSINYTERLSKFLSVYLGELTLTAAACDALLVASAKASDIDMTKSLMQDAISIPTEAVFACLMQHNPDLQLINQMLTKVNDVNHLLSTNETLMHALARQWNLFPNDDDNYRMIALHLIEKGAHPASRNAMGQTAFDLLSENPNAKHFLKTKSVGLSTRVGVFWDQKNHGKYSTSPSCHLSGFIRCPLG